MILTTLGMTALLGMMGLAIDVGALYQHRRTMQTAADAGAMAGGAEIYRAKPTLVQPSALAATATNHFAHGTDGVSVTVNRPPASGFYVGDMRYVEVIINQPSPTYFMRVFGWTSVNVPARAVAGVGAIGRNCVYVLDPSAPGAFQSNSSAVLDADCGMIVNSNNPSALRAASSSSVTAASISITGGYELNGGMVSPIPETDVPPAPDPLAYLTPPPVGSCTETNFHATSGTTTLNPGTYCRGIHVNAGARVILNPGMYVIKGGGINLESGAILEGNGVTIFLTEGLGMPYGTLSFQSGSEVHLKAPTTGPYAGILFYQDPNAGTGTDTHNLESTASSYFEGALYFPTQRLSLQSNSAIDAAYTIVVAREISMQSSASFTVRSDYGGLPGGSPIKRLSLVE
jgi:hypothetical protein